MDLRTQVQQHLGSAYTLERELGGGGMSRVFVADEERLGRKVVIKVLSPDLAQGINAERFEREIKLAASLQQANIVPVLTAGDVAGLPYFTMPFVEGESLRHRLAQGTIPITDVVAILRDVTRALAYAHARGVVHRDIKPDNVLLSGGTAVVTDFGIAKAISASRTDAPGATLTQLGTSIGTPAYMAPEQVAGDPNLDHRVDLYALGCMAFELLTGQQPFANRTPQKMLAAHLSEATPSVVALRGDAPAALVDLVNKLMEKDPAHRPQSAAQVAQALDAAITNSGPTMAFSAPGMLKKALVLYAIATVVVLLCTRAAIIAIGLPDWVFPGAIVMMALGLPALLVTAYVQRVVRHTATATPTLTPGGTMAPKMPSGTIATMAMKVSPHVTWRRTWRGGAFALGGFAALVVVFMTLRALGIGPWGSLVAAGKLAADDRIVLADLTASADDSTLAPIVVEAVRAALSQSRSVHLVAQADIADALQQMNRPKDTHLTDPAVVREVAARANAKAVLGGRLARVGTGYAVSLELSSAQGGAVLASYQATADGVKDLLNVVDGLTRKLRGRVGESLKQVQRSIPLQRATTTSLDALRKYSEAVVANDIDHDYDRAVRSAREAVALDSNFALAWRKLAVALYNARSSPAAQDSAVKKAARLADRLPDREKYLALGVYYDRARTAADRGKAVSAYQSAYAADSGSAVAANQLMIHYMTRRQHDSAERYVRREFQLEPVPVNAARIVTTLLVAGRVEAAAARMDTLLRTTPAAATSATIARERWLLALALGRQDSMRRIAERLVSSASVLDRLNGFRLLQNGEAVAGHLKRNIALDSQWGTLSASRRGSPAFDGLADAMTDILFLGRAAEGVRLLEALVAGRQWNAADPMDRPYLDVVNDFAVAGRPDRARAMLGRYQAEDPGSKAPDSQTDIANALAEIALADAKIDEALRQFRASGIGADGAPGGCEGCVAFGMARAFDRAGKPDSAVAYFEHYLSIPTAVRGSGALGSDWYALAAVHKRLGELYDARKDTQKALAQYGAFVEQWKTADPELQPTVASVKKRMSELIAQEGRQN